ncbi:MAG: hypothetical protein HQL32_03155 [Planctomycetes bacterium]|nr:hypothetical protein [Planctomycetota bacterium]
MEGLNYICSSYSLLPESYRGVDKVCLRVPELEKQILGQRLRRAGHLSKMAAISATACLKNGPENINKNKVGLFHGSAVGNAPEATRAFQESLDDENPMPSPFNFANSITFMTNFHVAQMTGIRGPGSLVSQEAFSFELALECALNHRQIASCEYALVGGSDSLAEPRESDLARFHCSEETMMGEGSSWLLLGRNKAEACAEVLDLGFLRNMDDHHEIRSLKTIVEKLRGEEKLSLMPGINVSQEFINDCLLNLKCKSFSYLQQTGYSLTAAAAAIPIACSQMRGDLVIHLSRCYKGNLSYFVFKIGNDDCES